MSQCVCVLQLGADRFFSPTNSVFVCCVTAAEALGADEEVAGAAAAGDGGEVACLRTREKTMGGGHRLLQLPGECQGVSDTLYSYMCIQLVYNFVCSSVEKLIHGSLTSQISIYALPNLRGWGGR